MAYKRPRFVREESWRYARVSESWRSPRGKTSRVRRSKDGWPPVVKIGYSRPKASRGGHPSGLSEIMVWRPKDLEHINPKTQAARIAHTVGERKRVMILDQAKKASITILNPGAKKEAAPAAPTIVEEPSEPAGPISTSAATEGESKPETAEETPPENEAEEETETTAATKAPKKRAGKGSKKRSKK